MDQAKKQPHSTRVIVGMSGGVDSSVSALLLKEQGYQVEGVFMQNWQEDKNNKNCPADQDLNDAQAVCEKLSIPFHTVNFSNTYWNRVFQYFLDEYANYRTPNPDIMCNKEIKFKAFLDYALEQGVDYIATGHYVRCHHVNNHYELLKGLDNNKDQSYFLHTLNQKQLSKSLFPIGELEKSRVREIARDAGFDNFSKKDSTGICFIGERKFKSFLNEYLLAKPGNIVTDQGEVISTHDGLMFHTIGQRQGLGIGGQKDKKESPWYVAQKNIDRNELIVVQEHDHPLLLSTGLTASQVHWISNHPPHFPLKCKAKTRYRQNDQNCSVEMQYDRLNVMFDTPQRAITPGQSVVFYHDDVCLGGAVIES